MGTLRRQVERLRRVRLVGLMTNRQACSLLSPDKRRSAWLSGRWFGPPSGALKRCARSRAAAARRSVPLTAAAAHRRRTTRPIAMDFPARRRGQGYGTALLTYELLIAQPLVAMTNYGHIAAGHQRLVQFVHLRMRRFLTGLVLLGWQIADQPKRRVDRATDVGVSATPVSDTRHRRQTSEPLSTCRRL